MIARWTEAFDVPAGGFFGEMRFDLCISLGERLAGDNQKGMSRSWTQPCRGVVMIVNNRIEGTRITVWDVLHYLEAEWTHAEITATLKVTETQVASAAAYIEMHRDEVLKVHRQIEARKARGNSPEIRAKAEKSRTKLHDWRSSSLASTSTRSSRSGSYSEASSASRRASRPSGMCS